MSDTCIVCLGDLNKGNGEDITSTTTLAKSPLRDGAEQADNSDAYPVPRLVPQKSEPELIAHLQPCGHDLHNECLTPWVERANSCPICRQSFHLVELCNMVGGEIISSYKVEDRTQIADLDPTMFLEIPDDEDEDQPCQACGEDDNEDVLMYCDGCQKMWHTYCVDLQEVPFGHWFCDNCRAQREVDPRQSMTQRSSTRTSRRRTRGQQRRQRAHYQANDTSWTRVWQSVWDRINVDLDFPYDDDDASATYLRRHRQQADANRHAHEGWLRRMQVAELNGAGRRFRETEPALLESRAEPDFMATHARRATPVANNETPDEMLAWHAFDQARAASSEPASGQKRKRKSASRTVSPAEPAEASAPTPIKRRRVEQSSPRRSSTRASSSRVNASSSPQSPRPRRPISTETAGPSFLQSLLREVEDSSAPANNMALHRPSPRGGFNLSNDQHSPRPSSPALSPLPSNHSSPRATSATPPPPVHVRPNSPTGLSSTIQPVFPLTEQLPARPSPEPIDMSNDKMTPKMKSNNLPKNIAVNQPMKGRLPPRLPKSSPPSRSRSNEGSPTRTTLSYNAKQDVQKLVSAALKPHYTNQTISKDEYTAINREISRMLYDKIGDFEALGIEGKAKWERVAGEEVQKAVGSLKSQAVTS